MGVIIRVGKSKWVYMIWFTGVDEVVRAMPQSAGGFPQGRSCPTSASVACLTREGAGLQPAAADEDQPLPWRSLIQLKRGEGALNAAHQLDGE